MITRDKSLICDILRQCEDGHEGTLSYIDHPLIIYIYCDGCLFPASVEIDELNIHVAIPKQYRGQAAINAGKKVIKWAIDKIGFRKVRCQILKTRKQHRLTMVFASWVGMNRSGENEKYYFYEVSA